MQTFYSLDLSSKNIGQMGVLPDSVSSIVFCNKINGFLFSDTNPSSLSILKSDKSIQLLKNDRIENPRGLCLDKDHSRIFYEDEVNGFSGYWVANKSFYTRLGQYAKNNIKLIQKENNNRIHFCYFDQIDGILLTTSHDNILCIDSAGRMLRFMGLGKPDFCCSTDPLMVCFNNPTGIVFSNELKKIFVSDTNNHVVRAFDAKTLVNNLIIGVPCLSGEDDGLFYKSKFNFPSKICCFSKNVFVVDNEHKRIRRIDFEKKEVSTLYEISGTSKYVQYITCSEQNVYFIEKEK